MEIDEKLSDEVLVLDVWCDENGFAAVPFNLAGQKDAVVYVDWHDGEDENLQELDEKSSLLGCVHRYADPKSVHRIEVSSPDWSRVCICGIRNSVGILSKEGQYPPQSFAGVMSRCRFRIKSPLPALKGTAVLDVNETRDADQPFEWKPEMQEGSMAAAMTLFRTIEEMPENLFSRNAASSFDSAFRWCRIRCAVPAGLFKGQGEAKSFSACFEGCEFGAPDALPDGLFQDCAKAEDFSRVFALSNIAAVPEGIFNGCGSALDYGAAFARTRIASLPQARLFAHSPNAKRFAGCFFECQNLHSAPTGLFAGTLGQNFYLCFYGCTNLESIGGIFSSCAEAETFAACFAGCESLVTIPVDLFWGCRKVKSFSRCFEGCESIVRIGHSFLQDKPEAEDFSWMFKGCKRLAKIAERLFEDCASAETFAGVFEDCRSLEILPVELFGNCGNVLSFHRAFAKCSSLHTVDVNLLSWSPKLRDVCQCFDGCASLNNAVVRIDSDAVENAFEFFPSRESSGLSVAVPKDTQTEERFQAECRKSKGWTVETFSL